MTRFERAEHANQVIPTYADGMKALRPDAESGMICPTTKNRREEAQRYGVYRI
jgi:hypothetical protein